jgi:hypothetical protein
MLGSFSHGGCCIDGSACRQRHIFGKTTRWTVKDNRQRGEGPEDVSMSPGSREVVRRKKGVGFICMYGVEEESTWVYVQWRVGCWSIGVLEYWSSVGVEVV